MSKQTNGQRDQIRPTPLKTSSRKNSKSIRTKAKLTITLQSVKVEYLQLMKDK